MSPEGSKAIPQLRRGEGGGVGASSAGAASTTTTSIIVFASDDDCNADRSIISDHSIIYVNVHRINYSLFGFCC